MSTFDLDPQDMKVLAKALDALPLSETAELLNKLQTQIDALPGAEWDELRSPTKVVDLT